MTEPDLIARLREFEAKITPGEWFHRENINHEGVLIADHVDSADGGNVCYDVVEPVDAEFIAFARNSLPAILAALTALTAVQECEAELVWLRATVERVRAALEYVEPRRQDERDAAIVADIQAGMSLRHAAAKHATGVGVVRGAIKRQALGAPPHD